MYVRSENLLVGKQTLEDRWLRTPGTKHHYIMQMSLSLVFDYRDLWIGESNQLQNPNLHNNSIVTESYCLRSSQANDVMVVGVIEVVIARRAC